MIGWARHPRRVAETYEYVAPLATAMLALIPLVALARAWRRTRSTRLLLAAAAFAMFVVSALVLLALAFVATSWADAAEWVEFGSDVVIVGLFALSFMWPRAEPDAG